MPEEDITILGETNFRDQKVRFGIKADDRRRHIYIIGKTGVGKTTMLETLAISDIRRGYGVGIIDPHGEFAEKMLDFVPEERIDDVIYFNPSDQDWPIAFNVIEQVPVEFRHLVASGLMGVFKKIWPDVWSARMEYIMNNSILALLEYPNSTLLGINRMLADKDFRQAVIDKITDPVVKAFWTTEFARYHDRFQVEAIAPIQNKVGQFISNPLIRNIIGQPHSKINIREAIDNGKILIMNLSKGLIGEDNSALLGSMLVTKIQLAAMSRVDMPESVRRDFYLHVDEFQNFATDSFANILSEARKYRLSLTLAHQYVEQLSDVVRPAVFGNVGTIICFRVGAGDAEFLEKEFMPEFVGADLVNLPKYAFYIKLMIDGTASHAFSAMTIPPATKPERSFKEEIIRRSRERYGTPRKEVEASISEWSGRAFGAEAITPAGGFGSRAAAPGPTSTAGRSPMTQLTKPTWEATCSNCGKRTLVPFQPDPNRPVYCEDCLKLKKAGAITEGRGRPRLPEREEVRVQSQPIVRVPQVKPISLSQLSQGQKPVSKTTPKFHRKSGEKPQVDVEGLREALHEALGEKNE